MRIYLFKSLQQDIYGFEVQATGINLPLERGPWRFVSRAETTEQPEPFHGLLWRDVCKGIRARGFHLFAPPVKLEEPVAHPARRAASS